MLEQKSRRRVSAAAAIILGAALGVGGTLLTDSPSATPSSVTEPSAISTVAPTSDVLPGDAMYPCEDFGIAPLVRSVVVNDQPVLPELRRRLAILRRPQGDADRTPMARCAGRLAAATGGIGGGNSRGGAVNLSDVRYVGRGPLGGRVYLVPIVPGDALRTLGSGTPAYILCLQSVGYPWRLPDAGGCTTAERMQVRSLTAYLSVPRYPVIQKALSANGVPVANWKGKVVSGIVPDGVVKLELHYWDGAFWQIPVRDNVVLYHTNRNIDYYRVYWVGRNGHFVGPSSETIRDEAVSPPPDLTPPLVSLGLTKTGEDPPLPAARLVLSNPLSGG